MKHGYRIALAVLVLLNTLGLLGQGGRGPQFRDVIPQGSRVQYKTYNSALMNRELRYGIYLPPSYETSGTQRYPVLYFLHGLNENEMRWSTRGETDLLLDKMVAGKAIGEFIVAIPMSSTTSFYTNARNGSAPWEDAVVKEFIPMIESTYRVNATRTTRGISGISMGGYGALKIAMKYPEMFGSVSTHSAALVPDFNSTTVTGRRLDQFKTLFDNIYGIGFAAGGPLDLTHWNANNPLELAKDTSKLQGLKVYFDCGTEDEYGFYAGQQVLDDLLTKAKYPHTAALHPGVHGWDYAKQHTQHSLLFHWNAFSGR
ncbi:MAG TPA: alpha/beta hydrolase family protein [Terriglobia bacterium]|nr:alpha/beta hydrolase family protein [Terriglobia bacterium]